MSSRTADYAGKYLRVKRVLGINTAIGAVYFDIPDTLGLRQGLEALMTLSTECEANACGGYDCTLKGIKVEGGTCLADYLHNRLREARSAPVSASPTYPTTTPSRY